MKEYELINLIASDFTKHTCQFNQTFTCDAEILNLNGKQWAFTIDEFSPEEDLFITENPEVLGANLITATISDLFAAGATPKFFMQALSLPKNTDKKFISQLTNGMKSILNKTNCALCGGDIGTADTWRFTGVAFGETINNKPLTRVLPNTEQTIWITGKMGDANLAAFMKHPTPQFECRDHEAKIIHQHATACIDTSGGFFDAIWTLHQLNTNVQIEINLDAMPYANGLTEFANQAKMPIETALMGGAGEYELLFATPKNIIVEENIATSVGKIYPQKSTGIKLQKNNKTFMLNIAPPCPRAIANLENYIQAIIKTTTEIFANGK